MHTNHPIEETEHYQTRVLGTKTPKCIQSSQYEETEQIY